MRLLVVVLVALVGVGCNAFLSAPTPGLGAVLPGQRVVIGRGGEVGSEWEVTVGRQGSTLRSTSAIAGELLEDSGCETEAGGAATVTCSWSGDGTPTFVQGFVPGHAASAELETSGGTLRMELVSLAALGAEERAYAVALPAQVRITRLTVADAQGDVIESIPLDH